MMELADMGQPRKLAGEIHRQLRTQCGAVPLPVPLEAIAAAVGIKTIVDHETESFEGTLLVKGNEGAIALRKSLTPERRRFTLGHELGHFVNPWHKNASSNFQCTRQDLTVRRDAQTLWADRPAPQRIEIEANEFSNALLIPAPEYRDERKALGSDPDIAHIRSLGTRFGVSLEVMTRTYVDTSKERIAGIITHNGLVKRLMIPTNFPYLGLKMGGGIPGNSLTARFRAANPKGTISTMCDVLKCDWLEQRGSVTSLFEQAYVQRDGWATTLLWVEEEEVDDEADDRNWNRRSNARWQ